MKILETARKDRPGEYLSTAELAELERIDHLMAAKVRAARKAQEVEAIVLKNTIENIFKKFDFSKAFQYRDKCYRDVGIVYRYCVFAMLCDDLGFIEDKLLFWLRTVLQSLNFPGGVASIRQTYSDLMKETQRQLPPEDFRLLEPYLARTVSVLPS
ncbi:hypothetical protein GC173_14885 [bacterium]|nr:hypothetical protein [bacterium]